MEEIKGSLDSIDGEVSTWGEDKGALGRGECGSCTAGGTTLGTGVICIEEDEWKLGKAGKEAVETEATGAESDKTPSVVGNRDS
jgi:hypothetical protein